MNFDNELHHTDTCQTIAIGAIHCDCHRRWLCDCPDCITMRNTKSNIKIVSKEVFDHIQENREDLSEELECAEEALMKIGELFDMFDPDTNFISIGVIRKILREYYENE